MTEFKNKRAVLFATTIGAFLIPYGASSINIALPAISTLILTVRIGEMQLNSDRFQPFLIGLRSAFFIFAGVCAFGVLASYARGKVLQSD